MATSMIAAARLLAHKTINGKYQTKMKMDEAYVPYVQEICSMSTDRIVLDTEVR